MNREQIPQWAIDALRDERRRARAAAKAFSTACGSGDVSAFYAAVDLLNGTVGGWRLAMLRASRLAVVPKEIRVAFLPVWIESRMLPLEVGDRRILADALRLLMPGGYDGPPLRLYRGAGTWEPRRRVYGFSWTTKKSAAVRFAEHWAQTATGAVILETVASPDAILLVRKREKYYDEAEVVVDPFRLSRVGVAKRWLLPNSAL